jgi:tetratricopeptide (TPR) repeat protein
MPLVHRGELHLWVGRYDEARADLDAAIARCPQTRWAWYGLACLDLIAGDPERALATCARGIRVMDNTEGPVAYLYRGEAYRLLGRLAEARAQLLRSCTLHPTRLSAWINLALVHGAAGDHSARLAVFRHLAQAAPHFVAEAAAELGDQVFEAAVLTASNPGADVLDPLLRGMLAMMRGNRASGCVTYFTSRGRMRYVAQRPPGEGAAREAQARILGELRRRIVAGGRRVPDGPPSAPS